MDRDRVADDVVEVLGYIAWDWVGRLTRGALLVMHDTESGKKRRKRMVSEPVGTGLFAGPHAGQPLLPEHVRECHRRLLDRHEPLQLFVGGRTQKRRELL